MDPVRNPFAPGAGSRPPELAGRDDLIDAFRVACQRAASDRAARPVLMLGLRGTGKTVLLRAFAGVAEGEGTIVSRIEAPEDADLARLIVPELRRVLRGLSSITAAREIAVRGLRGLQNFAAIFKVKVAGIGLGIDRAEDPEPGLADSGDLEFDLPQLFDAVGKAARAAGRPWVLLIDEVQYLSQSDLSALIVALHRASQDTLPIVFAGAGLPQIARLAGDAKSYAERLFLFPAIGPLTADAATIAITRPVEAEEATIDEGAVARIVAETRGYPFFIQEWASAAWDIAIGPGITDTDVEAAYPVALAALDEGFFKVRMDRLTRAEVEFVTAMAQLGPGPYPMADVAEAMGRNPRSLGPARAAIIRKGMIYSTDHGYLDFTVPLFDAFVRRQAGADERNPR